MSIRPGIVRRTTPGRDIGDALEGASEGCLGIIAQAGSNLGHRQAVCPQQLAGKLHTQTGEIACSTLSQYSAEALGENRARLACQARGLSSVQLWPGSLCMARQGAANMRVADGSRPTGGQAPYKLTQQRMSRAVSKSAIRDKMVALPICGCAASAVMPPATDQHRIIAGTSQPLMIGGISVINGFNAQAPKAIEPAERVLVAPVPSVRLRRFAPNLVTRRSSSEPPATSGALASRWAMPCGSSTRSPSRNSCQPCASVWIQQGP